MRHALPQLVLPARAGARLEAVPIVEGQRYLILVVPSLRCLLATLELMAISASILLAYGTLELDSNVACFTLVGSPESNGVCENFVKTLKRDHVRVNPFPDPWFVLHHLST